MHAFAVYMEKSFLEAVLSDLNSNLAAGKRSLCDMMDSGDGSFETRDGSVIVIPQDQLQKIWDVCDDSERLRLRLPIYVSTDSSSDIGAWKVEGKVESSVVSKLLGKVKFREDMVRLYHPDLKDLRKLIPDAIMMVFIP